MEQKLTGTVTLIKLGTLTDASFLMLPVSFEDYNGNREFERTFLNPELKNNISTLLIRIESLPGIDLSMVNKTKLEINKELGLFDFYDEFTKYNSRRNILKFVVNCNESLKEITVNYFK